MNRSNTHFQGQERKGVKRNLFFTEKFQLINVGGMVKLEDHHFATNILGINFGMNFQWMLKPLG